MKYLYNIVLHARPPLGVQAPPFRRGLLPVLNSALCFYFCKSTQFWQIYRGIYYAYREMDEMLNERVEHRHFQKNTASCQVVSQMESTIK